MPTEEIKTFCMIERVESLESIDIETETIDVSDLEEYKCHNFDGSISFEVDKKQRRNFIKRCNQNTEKN